MKKTIKNKGREKRVKAWCVIDKDDGTIPVYGIDSVASLTREEAIILRDSYFSSKHYAVIPCEILYTLTK